MPEQVDKVYVGFVCFMGIILVLCGLFMTRDLGKRMKECRIKYKGSPHSEEILQGTTKDGCQVKRVTFYTGECQYINSVYITNCKAVSWTESHGKSVSNETNVNQ